MEILITGSSGTIGTRLFETLLAQGHEVTGVDRRPNKWKPELDRKTRRIDLLDRDALMGLEGRYDAIIHLAANALVYKLVVSPAMAMENVNTCFNVLEYARAKDVGRVFFASSREVYGNIMARKRVSEKDMRVDNCESPYSASKMAGEAYMHAYSNCYGIRHVIARFSNVYGMYDDSDRVVPLWIRQMRKGEEITVFGREKTLDFTYIDDCVDGITRIVGRFDSVAGETFNIASGNDVRLTDVAEMLKGIIKSKSEIKMGDIRPGEVWKYKADNSKAKKLLGFTPKTSIEDGLKKTVEWYAANQK
ncbi:MAG: NAD-dependent epimerase/dehydratase family protein [Candidatus Paceibacterota bacterium]